MSESSRPRAPEVQVLGGAVLIQGPAVAELAGLARTATRLRAAGDGVAASPRALAIKAAAERAWAAQLEAMSRPGHGDVPEPGDEAASPRDLVEAEVTTAVAARIAGVSPRQLRRLRGRLGGRMVAGTLAFDRQLVEAFAQQRKDTP